MNKIGKYIYGIINGNCDGVYPVRNFAVLDSPCGISNGVYIITYKDISAVVSDSEIIDYTHMLKDALARLLLRHQEVIENVMVNHTVIPMRLGTYALDEEEVRIILLRGYQKFKEIFKETDGKVEIDVVAVWGDFDIILKEIAEDEEIKEFKQNLLNKKEGVTLDERLKIGTLIKERMDKRREEYVSRIETSLKTISHDIKSHSLMDEKMVMNSAFLIEKSKQRDFDERIEDLNNEFDGELNFRCVGPLPPYSFNTLEVKKLGFDKISLAKKILSLNDVATKEEIEKAYRRKAQLFHPDGNQGRLDSQGRFDEVTKAYRLLLEYCDVQASSFKEEFAKDAIIIRPVRY